MKDNQVVSLFDADAIGGKVGAHHPSTSRVAARTVKAGSQQSQILLALEAASPFGMTAFALSDHVYNGANRAISPNQTATRLGELREKGLVEFLIVGEEKVERPTTPGNTGFVHVLTTNGHTVARSLQESQAHV